MSDDAVADLVQELEIDVLVDLMGHTRASHPGIVARRCAPVQVQYLGYAGTMGAAYVDYLIADRVVVPPGFERYYSERIVFLPDCYQVNDFARHSGGARPSRAEVGLPETAFVFACFNKSRKIAPHVFDAWLRLLASVDDSVLWLLEEYAEARINLQRAAASRGIAPERLVFAPPVPAAAHLARHVLADLFLDTAPYGAHTSASDALWSGVPLVALAGRSFAARVSSSILTAAGMPELITNSIGEYETLALSLASDRDRLNQLRTKLIGLRAAAPLFDTDRFRRHIEAAYRTMVDRVRRGEAPSPFSV